METVRNDLIILGISPRSNRLRSGYLGFALAGTLLIELNQTKKIEIGEKDLVYVRDQTPPHFSLSAEALEKISAAKKPKPASHWIGYLSARIPHLIERTAMPLVESGLLQIEHKRWLGIIPYRLFRIIDPNLRERRIAEILDFLRGFRSPDPEIVQLVQLTHAAGMLVSLFPKAERKALVKRLKEIGRDEAVGKAVDAATAAIASSIAATAAITAATSGSH